MAHIFIDLRKQMDAELWLVGDGPEMPAVKALFHQHGVEEDVRYWGLQRNVVPILAQTDLMLLTSLNESFSLVALEAMACGVPVVSTDVGGLPEVVLHGKTGWLFSQGHHDQAVKLVRLLLSDPNLHRRMRTAAIEHTQNFGRDAIIPQYEGLYRELLYRGSNINWLPLRQQPFNIKAETAYPHGG
jgi:glycosyltransferase involved in cell wall biosynthesis